MSFMCLRNLNILWIKNFRLELKKFKKSKLINIKFKLIDIVLEYWYLKKMLVIFYVNKWNNFWMIFFGDI